MGKERETVHVVFSLSLYGDEPWVVERDVEIENIPGAWRVHGQENEEPPKYTDCPVVPGTGVNRHDAVLDFLANNYAGRRIGSRKVLEAIITTYLDRADNDSLDKTAEGVLQGILPK